MMQSLLRARLAPTLLFGIALTIGVAHAGKRDDPDVVDDALAYALTDRAKAIALLDEALAKDPDGASAGVLTLHAAEHRRLQGDRAEAREMFKRLLDTPLHDAARVGVALVRASNEIDPANLRSLEEMPEKGVLDTQNADRFLVLAIDAHGRGDVGRSNQYGKKAVTYAKSDPTVRARVAKALADLESGMTRINPTADLTKLERAKEALAAGDAARAATLAREAEADAAEGSPERAAATWLVKRAEADRAVDAQTIAVLLPISGKYEAVGRQVREAFEYGYKGAGGSRRLVYIDTLATPEGAVAALEKAVLVDGVVAVVGPLLSDATEPVVAAASALEVPLVSLSQSNESDAVPWVFQGVPSIGDQVTGLVGHVMGVDGLKRFAVFAPATAYGRRAAEEFSAEVARRGGAVAVTEFYDPEANALMTHAKKLKGKDFDAIFIPDNARKIPIACAALAYEEFPIGDFRPHKEPSGIPLLGLSGWNAPELVGGGGEYTRSSRFIDAFFVDDAPDFVTTYKGKYDRTPSSLEAVTVDAGRLVALASKEPATDRAGFRDALAAVAGDGSVTGSERFDAETRRVEGRLRILTIDRQGIKAVADAPPAP